jgi:hypothetical protein
MGRRAMPEYIRLEVVVYLLLVVVLATVGIKCLVRIIRWLMEG